MENIWDGVKGIVRKDDRILVLVKKNGTLDLPGGRVEKGETIKSALQREIDEETGLKVEIHDPVEEWSFYKTPDQLIKGITLECGYLDGKVKLCGEHKSYFWAAIDSINRLIFNRNFLFVERGRLITQSKIFKIEKYAKKSLLKKSKLKNQNSS